MAAKRKKKKALPGSAAYAAKHAKSVMSAFHKLWKKEERALKLTLKKAGK